MFISTLPFRAALAASCALCAFSTAQAQDVSGAVTLGYSSITFDNSNFDANTTSLDGYFDVDFGNGFSIGADVGIQSLDIDGASDRFKTVDAALNGRYRFASGLTLGGYVEATRLDFGPGDTNFSSYGVTLGYATQNWSVEGFIGKTDIDFSNNDLTDYGFLASYKPVAAVTLGGGVIRSEFDGGDEAYTLVRLAGIYDISPAFSVFGGFDRLSIDSTDLTDVGIGVGYDLAQFTGRSVILSLEYSQIDLNNSGSNIDIVEFGVTIPLGTGASKVPLNSVAGNVLRSRHSALSGLFDTSIGFF